MHLHDASTPPLAHSPRTAKHACIHMTQAHPHTRTHHAQLQRLSQHTVSLSWSSASRRQRYFLTHAHSPRTAPASLPAGTLAPRTCARCLGDRHPCPGVRRAAQCSSACVRAHRVCAQMVEWEQCTYVRA